MNANEAPQPRPIFLFWEKWLRPSYNALLLLASIVAAAYIASPEHPVPCNATFALFLIAAAVAANILFIAGPFADFYVAVLLRRRAPVATGIIFGGGILISFPLVLYALVIFWATYYPHMFGW